MELAEFKKRVNDIWTSLENADEHNLYSILNKLETLISEAKSESYFKDHWEKRVMDEIESMNNFEYRVRPNMIKKDINDRLRGMRKRFMTALNLIIKSPE